MKHIDAKFRIAKIVHLAFRGCRCIEVAYQGRLLRAFQFIGRYTGRQTYHEFDCIRSVYALQCLASQCVKTVTGETPNYTLMMQSRDVTERATWRDKTRNAPLYIATMTGQAAKTRTGSSRYRAKKVLEDGQARYSAPIEELLVASALTTKKG